MPTRGQKQRMQEADEEPKTSLPQRSSSPVRTSCYGFRHAFSNENEAGHALKTVSDSGGLFGAALGADVDPKVAQIQGSKSPPGHRRGQERGPKWSPSPGEPRRAPGETQETPWSPTGTRPEGNGQEEIRASKTRGRTRQQNNKRSSGATSL